MDVGFKPAKRVAGGGPIGMMFLVRHGQNNPCLGKGVNSIGKPELAFLNLLTFEEVNNFWSDDKTSALSKQAGGLVGRGFFDNGADTVGIFGVCLIFGGAITTNF